MQFGASSRERTAVVTNWGKRKNPPDVLARMKAKREYQNREEVEVAVLDALVDRNDEGMTVFEIRSHVDADIDDLETALANLKEDGLIDASEGDQRTLITPDERVVPDPEEQMEDEPSFVDRIIERLPL